MEEINSNTRRPGKFAANQTETLFTSSPPTKRCRNCDALSASLASEKASRILAEDKYKELQQTCNADAQKQLEDIKATVLIAFREYVRLKAIETEEKLEEVKADFIKQLEDKDKDYKCLLKVAVRQLCELQSELDDAGEEDTRLRQYLFILQQKVEKMEVEEADDNCCDCDDDDDEEHEPMRTISETDELERQEMLQLQEQQALEMKQKHALDRQLLVQLQKHRRLKKKKPTSRRST